MPYAILSVVIMLHALETVAIISPAIRLKQSYMEKDLIFEFLPLF